MEDSRKVKVTQVQNRLMSELLWFSGNDTDNMINYFAEKRFYDKLKPLYELSVSDIARAVHIGTVKLQVGDLITFLDEKKKRVIGRIISFKDNLIGYSLDFPELEAFVHQDIVRYATDEELEAEDEKAWWKSNKRELWELKTGDTLISRADTHSCDVKFIEGIDESGILLVNGVEDEWYEGESAIEEVKNKYKVFCFIEDRKDYKVTSDDFV